MNKYSYVICKIDCGSVNTTLYKNRKYRYEYFGYTDVRVYNEVGVCVYFFERDFYEYFYTEKEYRKEKLKKLNYESGNNC